jgi:hypothetical protein
MSWEKKRHVARIFTAFKRNKVRIYKEDIEALKNIDEFIDEYSKNVAKENLLYAKILCIYLRQNIHYFKSVKIALKELHNQLRLPLNGQIELLTMDLNMIDLQLQENEKDMLEKLQKPWSYENVEKSFYNSANDILKDVENYS